LAEVIPSSFVLALPRQDGSRSGSVTRGPTIFRLALAVAPLAWAAGASALPPTSGDDPADAPESEPEPAPDLGECSPSDHIECPERCPSFDTCYAAGQDGEGQIAYAVDDLVFECEGVDCLEASRRLDDYCCERGEFEPSSGGGCSLGAPAPAPGPAALAALGLAGVAGAGWRRRRRLARTRRD
jgi:MYXO-CTERM domain-containing protein